MGKHALQPAHNRNMIFFSQFNFFKAGSKNQSQNILPIKHSLFHKKYYHIIKLPGERIHGCLGMTGGFRTVLGIA